MVAAGFGEVDFEQMAHKLFEILGGQALAVQQSVNDQFESLLVLNDDRIGLLESFLTEVLNRIIRSIHSGVVVRVQAVFSGDETDRSIETVLTDILSRHGRSHLDV